MTKVLALFIISLAFVGCGEAEKSPSDNSPSTSIITNGGEHSKYTAAAYTLVLNKENYESYRALVRTVGFELGQTYSYTEYTQIKSENELGIAGSYDFLLLSTGGNAWDFEAEKRYNQQRCGWEMVYYSNHDLTLLHEVCHSPDLAHSFVRILKVSKGRNVNLYAE